MKTTLRRSSPLLFCLLLGCGDGGLIGKVKKDIAKAEEAAEKAAPKKPKRLPQNNREFVQASRNATPVWGVEDPIRSDFEALWNEAASASQEQGKVALLCKVYSLPKTVYALEMSLSVGEDSVPYTISGNTSAVFSTTLLSMKKGDEISFYYFTSGALLNVTYPQGSQKATFDGTFPIRAGDPEKDLLATECRALTSEQATQKAKQDLASAQEKIQKFKESPSFPVDQPEGYQSTGLPDAVTDVQNAAALLGWDHEEVQKLFTPLQEAFELLYQQVKSANVDPNATLTNEDAGITARLVSFEEDKSKPVKAPSDVSLKAKLELENIGKKEPVLYVEVLLEYNQKIPQMMVTEKDGESSPRRDTDLFLSRKTKIIATYEAVPYSGVSSHPYTRGVLKPKALNVISDKKVIATLWLP